MYCSAGVREKLESALSLLPPKNYLVLSLPAKIEAVLFIDRRFWLQVGGGCQHWSIYT